MEPIEQLSVIAPAVCAVVDRIPYSRLAEPTPCDKFSVHDVLNHMIVLGGTYSYLFRGEESPTIEPPFVYGWVPAAELRDTMDGLLRAMSSPGAMDRIIATPVGPLPGSVFARFVAFDGLVHGWDLATATGVSLHVPDSILDEVAAFARQALAPEMRDGDTFKEAVIPADDATPLQRLAAFSGRAV
jgi:uncharacterized protein (TIGR03086 family)